jgi:hypothetical protein
VLPAAGWFLLSANNQSIVSVALLNSLHPLAETSAGGGDFFCGLNLIFSDGVNCSSFFVAVGGCFFETTASTRAGTQATEEFRFRLTPGLA